jgi:hypothetical protein
VWILGETLESQLTNFGTVGELDAEVFNVLYRENQAAVSIGAAVMTDAHDPFGASGVGVDDVNFGAWAEMLRTLLDHVDHDRPQ